MRARLAARQNGRMDPRLRAAVDASRHWYDDVFALHGVPVQVEDGLWAAVGPTIPWHSSAKTLEPGVGTERVVDAVSTYEHCTVADSFGDLALDVHGFELLFEATWLHRAPAPAASDRLPEGWSVVADPDLLAEWSVAHDYAGVLPPAVLGHPRFRILACHRGGALVGGAVTHDATGAVGFSNAWGDGEVATSGDVLAAVTALHPGRALIDYAQGAELRAMVATGFTPLGPQRVWAR